MKEMKDKDSVFLRIELRVAKIVCRQKLKNKAG